MEGIAYKEGIVRNEVASNEKMAAILKQLRQAQGLSQANLAEQAGLSMKLIYQYERCGVGISMASIVKIDRVLGGQFLRAIVE